ncbi:hypothetical protein BJ165DRAFT_1521795 [Panaeolus papilionaceus]|nr:hypothetical protein BJ165DRAFT_1521795 [Panaeolus papilionaceus]
MKLAPINSTFQRSKPEASDQAKQAIDNLHNAMHYYCCSTIAQFDTPHQVLYGLRGALSQRQKDWENTGKIHENINTETIRISSDASSTFGILSDSDEPGNPVYRSLMTLKGKWTDGEEYVPDYLDDLESFYYVIGFISVCFTGPRMYSLDAGPPNPSLNLGKWMLSPKSPQSIKEKETALNGSGFTKGMISGYFEVYQFGSMLDEMHSVLKNRLKERRERRLKGLRLWNHNEEEYRFKANQDHQAFLNVIDRRLEALEKRWKVSYPPVPEKPQAVDHEDGNVIAL